jgi:iron(III) transport system permease protein
VLLAISAGLYLVSRWLFGQEGHASMLKGAAVGGSRRLGGWRGWLALLPFVAITAAATLPHLGVILLSVSRNWYGTVLPSAWTTLHFENALSHAYVVPGILNSLKFSLLAMLVCVAAGLAIAVLTVRWKPRGWQVFDVLSMMPLAIPGIILAFGYLSMATRYDLLRAWLDPLRDPTLLLVLAYGMRRLPYVVRAAVAGLQQTPRELEHAAANLGASGWTTLRRIVVPLIAANLIAGALFAFSFSMLEVSDSLILAQKAEFYPITRAIYELSAILGSGPAIACAFGVWAMVFLAATIFVAMRLLGRKIGAMFRF